MKLRLTTSSLALILFAAPTLALTPDEVWSEWTDYYTSLGYNVAAGSTDLAGETLTLKDVTVSTGSQEANETVRITIPQITMQATGDGAVRSTFSDQIGMTITATGPDGDTGNAAITLQVPGAEIVTSGEEPETTTTFSAPEITATVDRVEPAEGEPLSDVATVTMTDLKGKTVATDGGKTRSSTSTLAGLEYRVSATTPEASLEGSGTITALSGDSKTVMPSEGTANLAEQMNTALRDGLSTSGSFQIGESEHAWKFANTDKEAGEAGSGSFAFSVEGSNGTVSLSKDGLGYDIAAKAIDVNMEGDKLQAPIDAAIAKLSGSLLLPVMKANKAVPFKFGYEIEGLTLGDDVWAQFDPESRLPRDPASLLIDLSGMTKVTKDLFEITPASTDGADGADGAGVGTDGDNNAEVDADIGAEAGAGKGNDEIPFEPTAVEINQISISAVGASATAQGSLEVPEGSDASAPVGTLKASFTGVNGLMDNLVSMGLLPEDQQQGFRMMLAMFTKPGSAPDTLTSDIEFKEGGTVFVNGQQVK